ncbi:MAG: methyltransferase family protein, partial [Candidatus Thorarchaeota archaeon]
LDIYMLIKKGKASYPSTSFSSFLEGASVFFSTVFFWMYVIIAPILYLTKGILFLTIYFPTVVQFILVIIGIFLMTIGIIIASLGRIGRGAYLTKDKPKLATGWGHAIVRHPEYFMYILSFFGLPLVSLSPYLLVLLLGIPGYIIAAKIEEQTLIEEFGEEYKNYMKNVGRFFLKIKKK